MITRLVEVMLDREQDSPATLHSWAFGVTPMSYTVYVVAKTEDCQEIVAKVLLPLYTTPDGGQGARRREITELVQAAETLVIKGMLFPETLNINGLFHSTC